MAIKMLIKPIRIHTGIRFHFREFRNKDGFKKFCENERDFWAKIDQTVAPFPKLSKRFADMIAIIERNDLVSNNKNKIIDELEQITFNNPVICSDDRVSQYLLACAEHNKSAVQNTFQELQNPGSVDILRHDIETRKIWNYATALIANDYKNESKSIIEIKNGYESVIGKMSDELDLILKNKEILFNTFVEEANNRYKSFEEKRGELENLYKDKYKALEKTYQERIQLLVPAETWEIKKKEYSKRGGWWAIGGVVNGVLIFVAVLLLANQFEKVFYRDGEIVIDWILSLKWFLLAGVGLGVFIYLLRFFIKMALSAFHMSRDAEEKGVLTKFYLSLINEQAIDPKVEENLKHIIMTSLFARVDTGLLKGDSSPEMPVSGIADIVRLFGGK